MWYLDRFSLTPFDERYTSVPFEFMEYSYVRYMNNYGYEDIRDNHLQKKRDKEKQREEKKELEAQRSLLEESYPAEEAENILNAFAEIQAKAKGV